LKYAEAVGQVSTASRPVIEAPVAAETFTTDEELLERVPRTPPSGTRRKRPV
jgi:hypothetical protein